MKALTGKAKESFLKHSIGKEIALFETMLPIYQHALIIEWLDSVGINVEVGLYPNEDGDIYFSGVIFGKIGGWDDQEYYTSRQQATEKAIERALKIFNGNH